MPSIRRTRVRAPADAEFAEHGGVLGEALNDSGPTAARDYATHRQDLLNSPALATNNDHDKNQYYPGRPALFPRYTNPC